MKIVVYKNNMTTGRGADRAVGTLCGLLAATHEVTLLTGEGAALSCALDSRVSVSRIPLTTAALKESLVAVKPELIISTGTDEIRDLDAAFPTAFPAPVIQQFHIYPPSAFKPRRWIRNAKIKRALRRCVAIQVLLSEYVEITRKMLKYKGKVCAIGNVAPEIQPEISVTGAPIILYPAAFHKDKRQELLLRAFALLKKRVPTAKLILAGKGKDKEVARLQRLCQKLGIAADVAFPGYITDLHSTLAEATLVAFPSRMEGFPLTLVESAAVGRLAVGCTDCRASRDLVPKLGGILSKPTPAAFAEALEQGIDAFKTYTAPSAALREFASETISTQWKALITPPFL